MKSSIEKQAHIAHAADVKSSIAKQEELKQATQKNLKNMCERDREKVKGIFRFHECEGGTLSFVLRLYKWDEVQKYSLVDGEIYEIPLGVAKHLNKNGWYPEHSYLMDETGKPTMRVGSKKRRFSFQSMDFIDPAEMGMSQEKEIITATPL